MENRSHQRSTDRPQELFGVKGRKEALGKAAERKEEKHSGGNSSGGVEDKPQHWGKTALDGPGSCDSALRKTSKSS